MEYPDWPSKRSLERLGTFISAYSNNPNLEDIPILEDLRIDYRGFRNWAARWRTVPILIFEALPEVSLHEVEISARLSQLKDLLPNFIMILLRANCNGTRWITPPCPGKEDLTMVITEYIRGMPLDRYILSSPDFFSMLSLFFQLLRALEIARDRLGGFSGISVSSIVVRLIENPRILDYDGIAFEDIQYPIIINFSESSTLRDLRDLQKDIYKLLISMFQPFRERDEILSWFGVTYQPGESDDVQIETMSPHLLVHSVEDLLSFAWRSFNYRPVENPNLPKLEPQDIPGYTPTGISTENVQNLIRQGKTMFRQKFTSKRS